MSKGIWIVLIIILGGLSLWVVNIVANQTNRSEADYYLLKDTTEAAMIDAIDLGYYRLYGDVKINKEIFVESFLRRFSDSVNTTKKYDIKFYGLNELPPKVSITLDTGTQVTFNAEDLSVHNRISAILETAYDCAGVFPYDEKNESCREKY